MGGECIGDGIERKEFDRRAFVTVWIGGI